MSYPIPGFSISMYLEDSNIFRSIPILTKFIIIIFVYILNLYFDFGKKILRNRLIGDFYIQMVGN